MQQLIVSEQHKHAVALHQKIISSAELAQKNLWDMCMSLKEMRDGKLYKELGYSNFEDYCENEVGFNRKQAHKYISIIEKVKIENVHSSGRLGVTKLALLATVSEQEQAEIAEKVDLEETTVKQLKAEIDKLKTENAEIEKLRRDNTTLTTKLNEVNQESIRAARQREELADKLDDAREQIKALESRPVEVAVVDNSEEMRRMDEKIRIMEEETRRINDEYERQEAEALKIYRQQVQDLNDKYEHKLNEQQEQFNKKLAEAQTQVQPAVDESKMKFKIYLTSAFDACKRVVEFAKSDVAYMSKARELFNSILAELED